jgi:hypothetical protein
MYRIDNATAVPSGSGIPAPAAPGPRPNGYFTVGNPSGPVPATVVDADWLNCIQEEICTVIAAGSIALSKGSQRNLLDALFAMHGVQVFHATGTFTVPAGVTRCDAEVWGGGGGGGASSGANYGGGGAGGGYSRKLCTVTPGQVITVTVAPSAIGGAAGGFNGAGGATSSFGAFCTATGGAGGFGSTAGGGPSTVVGVGASGDINFNGTSGGDGSLALGGGGFSGASFGGASSPQVSSGSKPQTAAFPGVGGRGASNGSVAGGDTAGGLVVVRW